MGVEDEKKSFCRRLYRIMNNIAVIFLGPKRLSMGQEGWMKWYFCRFQSLSGLNNSPTMEYDGSFTANRFHHAWIIDAQDMVVGKWSHQTFVCDGQYVCPVE